MVELIVLGPEEEEVEVDDEAGTGTGVTVAPGNFVTVVDFNCGGFADDGNTFLAIDAPDGWVDFALKATVFWSPRFCTLLLEMDACGIVDCLFAIPAASEDEDDGVLLVAAEAEVFPPIRSRK